MKLAGLTHGGFYGHFGSKEDLAAEITSRVLTREGWLERLTGAPNPTLADVVRKCPSRGATETMPDAAVCWRHWRPTSCGSRRRCGGRLPTACGCASTRWLACCADGQPRRGAGRRWRPWRAWSARWFSRARSTIRSCLTRCWKRPQPRSCVRDRPDHLRRRHGGSP